MTFDELFNYYAGSGFTKPINPINTLSAINSTQPEGIETMIPINTIGGEGRDNMNNTTTVTGTKGSIEDLFNQYQNLNAAKKLGITSLANLAIPGVGTLLGLGGLGYDYFNPKGLNAFDVPTYADDIDTDRYEGFSFTETPGMQYGSGLDDPSLDTGDSDGGTGSGANEGGSGADSGSGTHDDPGD